MSTRRRASRRASIRRAAPKDRQRWLALWRTFVRDGPEPCGPGAADQAWTGILDPSKAIDCLILADDRDQAVGFLVYVTHDYTWSTRPICYLLDIYIAPRWRGGGHGRALMAELIRIGRERGWLKIYWMTQESNYQARAVYDEIATRSPLVRYDLPLAEP